MLLEKEYLLMLVQKLHLYNFNVWPLRQEDDLWNVSGAAISKTLISLKTWIYHPANTLGRDLAHSVVRLL